MKPGMLNAALQLIFAPAAFGQLKGAIFSASQAPDVMPDFAEIRRRETQHKHKRTRKTAYIRYSKGR